MASEKGSPSAAEVHYGRTIFEIPDEVKLVEATVILKDPRFSSLEVRFLPNGSNSKVNPDAAIDIVDNLYRLRTHWAQSARHALSILYDDLATYTSLESPEMQRLQHAIEVFRKIG